MVSLFKAIVAVPRRKLCTYVPRSRGKPEGLLGQPFYGWLGGFNWILRPFQRPSPNKAAEAA